MSSVAISCRKSTGASEREAVRLGIVGRILPQTLRTLVPRRIVVDGIASAHGRLVAAQGLPSQADARLHGSLVKLNACPLIRALSSNQELTGRRVKVRLPVFGLGNWGRQIPGETKIKSNVFRQPPIILDKWPENLPAAARDRTLE